MKDMRDDDHFLKVLRERVSQFEVEPDEKIWSQLQKDLKKRHLSNSVYSLSGKLAIVLLTALVYSAVPYKNWIINTSHNTRTSLVKNDINHETLINAITENKSDEAHAIGLSSTTTNGTEPMIEWVSNVANHINLLSENNTLRLADTVHRSDSTIYKTDSVIMAIRTNSTALIQKDTVAENSRKAKKAIRLYASLDPSLNYQIINPIKTDAVVITEWDKQGILSSKRFAISLEAGAIVPIGKRWEVFSGINYFHQSRHITYHYLSSSNLQVLSNTNESITLKPGSMTGQFNYSMSNIGMQGGTFYKIKDEKLMHKVGLSILYQHGLRKADSENLYSNNQSDYLFAQLHYRFEWKWSDQLNLYVQPTQSFGVWSKERLMVPVNLTLYRSVFSVGVIYHFE